nr:hypothetical protein [Tanacetum cinerariifolium]
NPKTFQPKNKGLVAEIFDWDEEEVFDDEEVTQVKVLMALANDELTVGKSHAQNGEWVDITKRKEDHRTSNHEMYVASFKRSESYKAQPYQYASTFKQILKAKAKPFPPFTHYGFNDHRPDDYRNYPEYGIYGSYDHSTSGYNPVIHIRGGVLAESSQSDDSSIGVKCNIRGSIIHSTTNHNEFDHFKRDLINIEWTHEQNVQDDQMITQPTNEPSENNTEDRWSKHQHIKLVNIIGIPREGMLTRSMATKLTVALASECLFADFLSEIEPKKVSEALKHSGWIDAMQEELN